MGAMHREPLKMGLRLEEYREGDSAKDSLLLTQKLLLCPLGDGHHLEEALPAWISASLSSVSQLFTHGLARTPEMPPQLTPKFLDVTEPWRQGLHTDLFPKSSHAQLYPPKIEPRASQANTVSFHHVSPVV